MSLLLLTILPLLTFPHLSSEAWKANEGSSDEGAKGVKTFLNSFGGIGRKRGGGLVGLDTGCHVVDQHAGDGDVDVDLEVLGVGRRGTIAPE